jgi:fatty-acyl-CoA synthase
MAAADYDALPRVAANHQPLTPLLFLERAAQVHPDHVAVVHGALRRSYRALRDRCVQLAHALAKAGIGRGDTVAALLPNTPAMLECHYGVPMTGGVLNTLNTRLDAGNIAYCLDHGEAKVVIVDRELVPLLRAALTQCAVTPLVIEVDDPEASEVARANRLEGATDYEAFLARGDAGWAWPMPGD